MTDQLDLLTNTRNNMDNPSFNLNPGQPIADRCISCARHFKTRKGLQEIVKISSCQHQCCKNCLISSITSQLESGKGATCPFEKGNCQKPISDAEVQAILPDKIYQELQNSFMEKLLTKKNLFECKNNLCGFSFEPRSNSRLNKCPSCQAFNCVPCEQIHIGICPLIKPSLDNSVAVAGPSKPKKRREGEMDAGEPPNSLVLFQQMDNQNGSNVPVQPDLALNSNTGNEGQASIKHKINVVGDGPVENAQTQAFRCQFCYNALKEEDSVILDTCSHLFCKDCLKVSVETSPLSQIPCLLHDQMSCGGYLTDSEVKHIVEKDTYNEYAFRSVKQALVGNGNVFQCRTPNCIYWCEFEPGKKTLLCPLCNNLNCLQCRAIHEEVSCEMYQDQVKLGNVDDLIKKQSQSGWNQLAGMLQRSNNPLNPTSSGSVLEQLADVKLLENTTIFECPVCMSDVNPKEGVILQECLHTFCKQCLIEFVDHSNEPVLKCPYMDENYSCICHLLPREVKALVPQEKFEKYQERIMKFGESSLENSFHCGTPNCPGWCINDENELNFGCPLCLKTTCMKCKAIHTPFSCEEFNKMSNPEYGEKEIEKLIQQGLFMKCPKCTVLVQKDGGCEYFVCRNCKTQLCWATKGPRWGPNGRGDISGGCRCMVNGIKCHPSCSNCH